MFCLDKICKVNYTKNVKLIRRFGEDMENRLQELRKAKKISQSELAQAMEVTRQTIISLEKGRYNASLELAFKLAQYFQLSIEDIFIYKESES